MAEKAASFEKAAREAQDEIRVLKAKADERDAYTLAELRTGAYAYARKKTDGGNDQEPPYLCQPCYDKGVKSVLRLSAGNGEHGVWRCPCDKDHLISMQPVGRNWTASN